MQPIKRLLLRALGLATAAALCLCPASLCAGHTRDEVRSAFRALESPGGESPYREAPAAAAPYAAGALTEAAARDALDYLNLMRWLAGLEPVELSAIYADRCQRGAVLLAALDRVDHSAPRPDDMDQNFYDSAHLATTSANLARFNWMRPGILRDGVEYFLRDDGDINLPVLGHRRWALNPCMAATGFGLANSRSGNSYVVMYAHDLGSAEADWDAVCWPAAGAFPATLMHGSLAWSVSLNPARYDLSASDPVVTLSESTGGLRFRFRPAAGEGDGFCALNAEGYGSGPCLIFRPDFSGTNFTDYQQNQRWTVRVDGLQSAAGGESPVEYTVEMISLYVEDAVNVEVSPLEAALAPGETLRMSADVIPAYADDLRVFWFSSDETVATVDGDGLVTAVSAGRCAITVRTAGGLLDSCAVTVGEK